MAVLTPQRVDARFSILESRLDGLVQSVLALNKSIDAMKHQIAALLDGEDDDERPPKAAPRKKR